jgi:8-oxo-dGTP diphosphatase
VIIASTLSAIWHRLAGRHQWRLLWLTQAKFMVGVSGVVFDDDRRVLLLRHRFWPEGSWGLPGGYARRGESMADALARELGEETGYRISDVELLDVVSGYRLRLEVIFRARLTGGTLRMDRGEVLDAGFFAVDDLPEGLLASHRRHIEVATLR